MTAPKHPPPEPLSDSDLQDIREYMADWGVWRLAQWIGCSRQMVRKAASEMGLPTPPSPPTPLKARRAREQVGVTKVCMTCDQVKLLREFHVQSSGYQHRRSRCRECEKLWAARRYSKPEQEIRT